MFKYFCGSLLSSWIIDVAHAFDAVPYGNSCTTAFSPANYNLDDSSSAFDNTDFFNSVQTACTQGSSGSYQNPTACNQQLNAADQNIQNIFQTSDTDLTNIARALFGCTGGVQSAMATALQADLNTLVNLNQTIYGNPSMTPADPGLLRVLMTMMDGINEIQGVAQGQLSSIKQATNNQITAATQIKTNLIATAQAIKDATIAAVQQMVGNRTLAQNQGFADAMTSLNATLNDLGDQADDIVSGFNGEFNDLSGRYNTWTNSSNTAIQTASSLAGQLKTNVSTAVTTGNQLVAQFKTDELTSFNTQMQTAQTGFSTAMQAAQTSVATSLGQLAGDMASAVAKNRGDFLADYTSLQQDIDGQLQQLSGQVDSDSTVNDNNENEAQTKADASMQSLSSLINNSVLPLVQNVAQALSQVTDLEALIVATRNQIDSDAASVLRPAQTNAQSLNDQITKTFGDAQTSFTTQYNQIRTQMMQAIQQKVGAGRSQLADILNGVQSTQSDAADQQGRQGQTSMIQAQASISAASVSSAIEQTAGDQAKVGLDTMISVVSAALSDSQSTLTDIQKANLQQILNANRALTANEQATIEAAYKQVQASYSTSSAHTNDVQSASFGAQSEGQDLMNSIAQGGAQMDGSVSYQTNQAQGFLTSVANMLASTNQSSNDLLNQMAGLESQAPGLVQVLLQKIAAYQALAVSQGINTQGSASAGIGTGATSTLNDLGLSLQQYAQNVSGVSSDLHGSQSQTSIDSATLTQDLVTLLAQLASKAQSGSSLVQSDANSALSTTTSQIKGMSSDALNAIAALTDYNSDLVKQKEASILSSGSNAMASALTAADYLTTSAQQFKATSDSYIQSVQNLGAQANINMTQMLDSVNGALTEVTSASDSYMQRLTNLANSISGWPSQVLAQASAVNVAIQQEISNTTQQIVAMKGISTDSIAQLQDSCNQLQSYINTLLGSFQQQRQTFNDFAQNYTIRRIAVLTGLSQSIVAQKAQFLSSLANSDLTDGQKASRTTSTLQGLLQSLETANQQGALDKDQAAQLISNIGNGVNSLTSSLSAQMQNNMDTMQQQALQNGISNGNQLQATADAAASSAQLLGTQFINAFQTVAQSSTAANMAAASTDKDIYGIAGLLKNTAASSKLKIANLLRQVQTGNITMDDAIAAAGNLSSSQINTVQDIVNTLSGFLGQHDASVQNFESNLGLIEDAVNKTVLGLITEHGITEGNTIADLTAATTQLDNIKSNLLGTGAGSIQQLQTERSSKIDELENYVNNVLYGSSSSSTNLLSLSGAPAQSALLQRISRHTQSGVTTPQVAFPQIVVDPQPAAAPVAQVTNANQNQTIPDAIFAAQAAITSAKTDSGTANDQFSQDVANAISAGASAINDILSVTQAALQV